MCVTIMNYRSTWNSRPLAVTLLMILLFAGVTPTSALELWGEGDKLHVQFGAYTHFGSNDEYEGPPILGNIELNKASNWLFGLALFNNSFGQFSQYAYIGKKWQLPQIYKPLHVKLTAGVVHGYKDEWEDKIAYNQNGFAPGIVPSIGIKKNRWAVDLVLLGGAGMMLAVGYDLFEN